MRKIDFIIFSVICFLFVVTCIKKENTNNFRANLFLETAFNNYKIVPNSVFIVSEKTDFLRILLDFNNFYYQYNQYTIEIEKLNQNKKELAGSIVKKSKVYPLENQQVHFEYNQLQDELGFEKGDIYRIAIQLINSTRRMKDQQIDFQIVVD